MGCHWSDRLPFHYPDNAKRRPNRTLASNYFQGSSLSRAISCTIDNGCRPIPFIGAIRHLGTATPMHTTAWLLDRIREGDTDARKTLIERVQPLLQRFAHGRVPRQLRPQEDTADLVQITWLKVLDKLELIDSREPGTFFAYLRAVLINALRESLRRHRRSPQAANDGVNDSGDEVLASLPAANVELDDWLAWEQSLAVLSPAHRGLILMRFEFGMSFAEIGAELGESADGVRMKLNRTIARMAQVS